MSLGDPALRLGLRAPVLGHRRRLVRLDVGRALAPVEDDVRRDVNEPRADLRRRPRDVPRTVDVDR